MQLELPATRYRIFVYGTLRPGGFYYLRLCSKRQLSSMPACARGFLYHLDAGYPGVTLGDGWVFGDVLCFDDPKLLQDLDALEGFRSTRPPAQNLYQREEAELFHPESKEPLGKGHIYRMSPHRVQSMHGIRIQNGIWRPEDFGNPLPED